MSRDVSKTSRPRLAADIVMKVNTQLELEDKQNGATLDIFAKSCHAKQRYKSKDLASGKEDKRKSITQVKTPSDFFCQINEHSKPRKKEPVLKKLPNAYKKSAISYTNPLEACNIMDHELSANVVDENMLDTKEHEAVSKYNFGDIKGVGTSRKNSISNNGGNPSNIRSPIEVDIYTNVDDEMQSESILRYNSEGTMLGDKGTISNILWPKSSNDKTDNDMSIKIEDKSETTRNDGRRVFPIIKNRTRSCDNTITRRKMFNDEEEKTLSRVAKKIKPAINHECLLTDENNGVNINQVNGFCSNKYSKISLLTNERLQLNKMPRSDWNEAEIMEQKTVIDKAFFDSSEYKVALKEVTDMPNQFGPKNDKNVKLNQHKIQNNMIYSHSPCDEKEGTGCESKYPERQKDLLKLKRNVDNVTSGVDLRSSSRTRKRSAVDYRYPKYSNTKDAGIEERTVKGNKTKKYGSMPLSHGHDTPKKKLEKRIKPENDIIKASESLMGLETTTRVTIPRLVEVDKSDISSYTRQTRTRTSHIEYTYPKYHQMSVNSVLNSENVTKEVETTQSTTKRLMQKKGIFQQTIKTRTSVKEKDNKNIVKTYIEYNKNKSSDAIHDLSMPTLRKTRARKAIGYRRLSIEGITSPTDILPSHKVTQNKPKSLKQSLSSGKGSVTRKGKGTKHKSKKSERLSITWGGCASSFSKKEQRYIRALQGNISPPSDAEYIGNLYFELIQQIIFHGISVEYRGPSVCIPY